jgi:hypothetical protein
MAISLTERPNRFGFSLNEARYVFFVTNPLTAGCLVEVKLYCHTIKNFNAPPQLIKETKLYPDPDGRVVFYCNDYLHDLLEPDVPGAGNTDIVPAYRQQLFYWIEFRQVTDISPNNPWVIAERARKRIILLGGIEVQKFERNNFFINYITAQKNWFTWIPSNRFVFENQEHYLTWLKYGDEEILPKLKAQVHYTDGSTSEKEIAIANHTKSYLFHCPAGVEQLGLNELEPNKKIHYYDVLVFDPTQGVLTNGYRFYIDYDVHYFYHDWVYLNSLGGIDALRIKTIPIRDMDREVDSASRLNVMYDINDAIKQGDTIDTNILLTKKFKGDAGFLWTREEQNGLADLMASMLILEAMDGRWLRVRLQNKSLPFGGSNDTKWSLPVEWTYGYMNKVYTPDKVYFGNGNNNNEVYDPVVSACPAPTGLAANEVDVSNGLSMVEFTWSHPGNILVTVEAREDGTTEWLHVFTNNFGGNILVASFVADGRTINWRLKLRCYNEDDSVYVNGPDFTITDSANACAIPTNLSWLKGSASGGIIPFTFSWNHSLPAANYTFEYREVGSPTWVSTNIAGTSTVQNFLDDGKTYEWRLKAICGAGSESPYVTGMQFVSSSSVTCSSPYNVTRQVVAITESTVIVRFSWSHPGSADFLLEWSSRATGNTGGDITSDLFTEIEFTKTEERIFWKVAAQCTPGDYSSFSNGSPVNLLI